MSDANGKHAPIGSIVTSLVDVNSDNGVRSPEYSYKGYLYCDGRELLIRDYPQLYAAVRNTYGGNTQVTKTQSSNPGGIRRSYWINNKLFFNLYYDPAVNSTVKLPYPYGTNFRITTAGTGRGSFPDGIFALNTFYSLVAPTENVSAFLPIDGTAFAYEVQFPSSVNPATLNQAGSTLDFTQGGVTHPNIIFAKQFNLRDYPYNIGNFRLPDYRDRVIVGYGAVDGLGSPTVENALVNAVGQKGGIWFISKNNLLDGGVFFTVGNVKTRGYTNITADITSFLTGNVQFTFGPLDDYIFSRPVEHFHYLLSSEPNESFLVEFSGVPADQYAVAYSKTRANVVPFEPANPGGLPLGHAHGLVGYSLNDPKLATIGNSAGIGATDAEGNYRITSSPSVSVTSITYDAGNNVCIVTTATNHNLSAGNFVTITGATPSQYSGSFQVLSSGLLQQSFQYRPTSAPTSSPAGGLITARLAAGTFEEVVVTPNPIAYVVDASTVIGGKEQTFDIPGVGVVFDSDTLTSPGTINTTPIPASTGEVKRVEINLIGPGGGGADSNSDGGTGGFAFATFNVDGNEYTIYAYGGGGGRSGNSGGTGGSGGTFLVPASLIALGDTVVEFAGSNGASGQSGGGAGSSTSTTTGGGLAGVSGSGGTGRSASFTVTSNDPTATYTSSGTWTLPASSPGEISTTVTVRAVGGGGGSGNPNANSGCEGTGAIGGSGNDGAIVTATLTQLPSTLSFTIGRAGAQGFNNRDGNIDGTGYEAGPAAGGSGSSFGGSGGTGAWGNGATGGGGGGSTGVFFNGANAIIGAGGGGGGGGSGGGYNGGGTTDGCYAGGNGQVAVTDLTAMTSAMDFKNGGAGTTGGCSAGGGGGGGGGAGPTDVASGGVAGQAGVGHNGNGGGTGGRRGNSAYRSDYCNATGGSSAGRGPNLDGYVQIDVARTFLNYGPTGGAGGQGGSLNLTIKGRNIAVTAGLQNAGNGGGSGSAGNNGFVEVRYVGLEGGGTETGEPTVPFARFYDCDASGNPQGGPRNDQAWQSSTFDGMIPVSPGLGTNATNKFSMIVGAGAPTYGGFSNRYLPFTGGPDNREYIIGPFDLTGVNRIRFTAIKGTNFNGGATPEEDLILYWRNSGSNTVNLLNTVVSSTVTSGSWQEYFINLEEGSNARGTSVELILRQTRPQNQDDNNVVTEDNYGISMITFFYASRTVQQFTPGDGTTISGIDAVTRNVSAIASGIVSSDGQFVMSSSTPVSTTALVVPETDIPLITRYHRVKYLIKAI
jgi:hypothetical protein